MSDPAPPSDASLAARYRPRLVAERAELAAASGATSADRRPVELDQQSVGRLSRMDALQNQALAQGLEARRAARLRAIDAALGRLETGAFGYCDGCGDFIGTPRLDLDPCAARCTGCAR
ncbi:hypothetical protein OG2516_13384 [Oceanicola granulosus HTCC2516]|uniref:Uncharacterized protein n=1 Tax=Oceanicola granulosus (strain ATCC BAA-861 / DSM 15982 / KCTC 12143 / HTCC2516) TaxID=314256 RepID=Q2CGZ1_OCEGH|nr:hypothetical protein [Oceanicola granulosus]EAR52020.1 hypothetical protein OG2516_13384 [Oceanicola granulosus HTCC2516]